MLLNSKGYGVGCHARAQGYGTHYGDGLGDSAAHLCLYRMTAMSFNGSGCGLYGNRRGGGYGPLTIFRGVEVAHNDGEGVVIWSLIRCY